MTEAIPPSTSEELDVRRLLQRAADSVPVQPVTLSDLDAYLRRTSRRRRIAVNALLAAAAVVLVVIGILIGSGVGDGPDQIAVSSKTDREPAATSTTVPLRIDCGNVGSVRTDIDPPLSDNEVRTTLSSAGLEVPLRCTATDGTTLDGHLASLSIVIPSASCHSVTPPGTGVGQIIWTDGTASVISLSTDLATLRIEVVNGPYQGATGSARISYSLPSDCAAGAAHLDIAIGGIELKR